MIKLSLRDSLLKCVDLAIVRDFKLMYHSIQTFFKSMSLNVVACHVSIPYKIVDLIKFTSTLVLGNYVLDIELQSLPDVYLRHLLQF